MHITFRVDAPGREISVEMTMLLDEGSGTHTKKNMCRLATNNLVTYCSEEAVAKNKTQDKPRVTPPAYDIDKIACMVFYFF